MRHTVRIALTTIMLLAVVVVASPLALYWVGLIGVRGLPDRPTELAPLEQRQFVWQQARGSGPPTVDAMNPYSVSLNLLAPAPSRPAPGELVAWWVASGYLLEHRKYEGMGWWHLSGMALAIWLSRNWSSEELMSAGAQALKRRGLTPPSSGQTSAAAHVER
jgi:hypothetical protein